jgi:hypothetical protein
LIRFTKCNRNTREHGIRARNFCQPRLTCKAAALARAPRKYCIRLYMSFALTAPQASADSSPLLCAKPPVGSAESHSCQICHCTDQGCSACDAFMFDQCCPDTLCKFGSVNFAVYRLKESKKKTILLLRVRSPHHMQCRRTGITL